jgi:hypothetical protein
MIIDHFGIEREKGSFVGVFPAPGAVRMTDIVV